MKKNLRDASGVITVMVTLMLIPLLSFGTLIMEAGRYLSAKQVLADAQITASMSILANYNTYLYERFGIVAIDPDETIEKTKNTFISELKYNSDNVDDASSSSKLYNLNSDVKFETIYNLSDYTVLKRQVLEYAKYSVPYTVISNKLDLDSLFDNLMKKILGKDLFKIIDKLVDSAEKSVDVMDEAFKRLGRTEYRTLDFLNYILGNKYDCGKYTLDLYYSYIMKDISVFYGNLVNYGNAYGSGRDGYIGAIKEKIDWMNANPDPQKALDSANNIQIKSGASTVPKTNLYKAAIKAFLEDDNNKPTDTNPDGKEINRDTSVSVSYTYSGYTGSYDLKNGTAQLTSQDVTKKPTIKIKTALEYLYGEDTKDSIDNYSQLNELAERKGLTKAKESYLATYKNELQGNGWNSARAELITELKEKKRDYDTQIQNKNNKITEKAKPYKEKLENAKDRLELLIKSIEDEEKTVSGTSYKEGSLGRLKHAKETYKTENEKNETQESFGEGGGAATRGSNSESVEERMGAVVADLEARKESAKQCKSYIDQIVRNIDNTSAYSIKSYSEVNSEDKVNGTTVVGATAAKLAGYVSDNFSKIDLLVETPAVNVKDGFDVEKIKDVLSISDLWNAIKKLKDTIDMTPATYDEAYVVTLNDSDYNLLPTMKDESPYNKSDETYVNQLLTDVQKTLGDVFGDTVFSDKIVDQDMSAFQSTATSLFGSSDGDSTENSTISNLYDDADSNKSSGILKLVIKIKEIIEKIKSAIQALKNLFGSFKELISGVGEWAYYTILLDTYIQQKFPSRMNKVSEATTFTKKATSGSYFSGCCVEYCIFGSKSEKANQQSAFWMIFGIRAILNCIQILLDSTAMEIISACNVFAPLMFIAMLYVETNIDMNFLVRNGESVPLWKKNIHLSAKGITNILKNLTDNIVYITTSGDGKKYHKSTCATLVRSGENGTKEKISRQKAKLMGFKACGLCKPGATEGDDGFVSLTYDNYLYVMMLFISSKTKLEYLADLIQLETRYYETKQGVSSNFRIDKTSTYVRSEVVASYNTLLPMFSLGSSGNGFAELKGLEYVGY